jgi:hypothetical protein
LGETQKKYEPVSVPFMVILDKQFRESSIKKGQDTEVWISELEDLVFDLMIWVQTVYDSCAE